MQKEERLRTSPTKDTPPLTANGELAEKLLRHLLLLHLLHSEHIGNTAAELSDHTHTH